MDQLDRRTLLAGTAATAGAWFTPGAALAQSGDMAKLKRAVGAGHAASVKRIQDWIALPSIAAENRDMQKGAEYMAALARDAGFTTTEIVPTDGAPGVFATMDNGARRRRDARLLRFPLHAGDDFVSRRVVLTNRELPMSSIRIAAAALAGLAAAATVAQTPPPKSLWTKGFDQGVSEYSTGTFDQPVDGGIRIACLPTGEAVLGVQIKGVAPAERRPFLLIPATRNGKAQTFSFSADTNGLVRFARARSDRQLARLWAAFRGGNNVTIRFADGSFSVQSLIGVTATLPPRPCG